MVSSRPRSGRWCAMSATSPNHDGVEGTDWGEVWMLTAEGAILLMKPPCEEILLFFFPFKEAHFCALYHPPSPTSLRNSWVRRSKSGHRYLAALPGQQTIS